MAMGLGVYIRQQRELVGLSQAALARAVGVKDRSYITQIESGRTKLPGHEMRLKIAHALGVREADLLIAAGELEEEGAAAAPRLPIALLLRELDALNDRNLDVIRLVVHGLLERQEPDLFSEEEEEGDQETGGEDWPPEQERPVLAV